MTLLLVAGVKTLAGAVLIASPCLRKRMTQTPTESPDMRVYRDQLVEVERDLRRGVLSEDEAERTRTEVSRRLLDADKAAHGARASGRGPVVVAVGLVLVAVAATPALYGYLGAAGARDMPFASRDKAAEAARLRPSQQEAEAKTGDDAQLAENAPEDYLALVKQLRATAEKRPDDLKGQELLFTHEARLGFYAAARRAKAQVIRLKKDNASASDFSELAEMMIIAAGGYVSPEAEAALSQATKLDPTSPRTRYFSGLALAQSGRADLAYQLWSKLLAEGPADAPWIPVIRQQIGEVARLAGIDPQATLPGPDAQQMQDAQNMSATERTDMIRSMVARLSDRLASEGGTAKEWARLIQAYGVLDEPDRAATAWAASRCRSGSSPARPEAAPRERCARWPASPGCRPCRWCCWRAARGRRRPTPRSPRS